jgi:pilus assembly protein CpaC
MFLLLFCQESKELFVEEGTHETFFDKNIEKIAVGNSKIIRVRLIHSNEVLISGLREGSSSLILFGNKFEKHFTINVVKKNVLAQVTRVSLEFLELNSSLTKELGVKWPEATTLQFQGSSNFEGLNISGAFKDSKLMLNHFLKEGWAKTLAKPELFVKMGEEAHFHSGGELPITVNSESYGRNYKTVQWKPYGLTVKVRPRSTDFYHIHSDILMELSELNRSQTFEGIPSLAKRKVDTKMQSVDGETVVLSGLLRQAEGEENTSVPFLSSIPLLGILFKSQKKDREESEILVAVTVSLSNQKEYGEKINALQKSTRTVYGK